MRLSSADKEILLEAQNLVAQSKINKCWISGISGKVTIKRNRQVRAINSIDELKEYNAVVEQEGNDESDDVEEDM